MEGRIAELELRFLEQERLLQELSGVVYAQQRELDALKAELAHLGKKLRAEPGLVDASEKDPPPHY